MAEESGYDGGCRRGSSPSKGSSEFKGTSSHAYQSGPQNLRGVSYVKETSNAIPGSNCVARVNTVHGSSEGRGHRNNYKGKNNIGEGNVLLEELPCSDTNVVKGSPLGPIMGLAYNMDKDLKSEGKVGGPSKLIQESKMDYVEHSLGTDSVVQNHGGTALQGGPDISDSVFDNDINVVSRSGVLGVKGWK